MRGTKNDQKKRGLHALIQDLLDQHKKRPLPSIKRQDASRKGRHVKDIEDSSRHSASQQESRRDENVHTSVSNDSGEEEKMVQDRQKSRSLVERARTAYESDLELPLRV